MMRWLALLAFSLAACEAAGDDALAIAGNERPAPPAARPVKPIQPTGGPCALSVAFGSYAMGIDRPTLERVEALLAADPAVAGVERRRQGREGETELCAEVASAADAERLFRSIAALLPADPRGPVTVRTASGLRAEAPRGR